ncbi:MAG: hypothetical protein RMJ98_20355, partial [Myxococcales bacterium]|nr:hypothetical protein [Polyangiaceae bacterium]MDW8251654.1 hypothetical protein [Myxococcales bacterium]
FRLLFRGGLPRAEALAKLLDGAPLDPWVARLAAFLRGSGLRSGCKPPVTGRFVAREVTRVWRVAPGLLPLLLLSYREGISMPRFPLLSTTLPRTFLPLYALLAVAGVGAPAWAECPPGAWFCADAVPEEEDKSSKKDDKSLGDNTDKRDKGEKGDKGDKGDKKDIPKEPVKVGPGESAQVPPGTTVIVQTAPPPPAAPPPAAAPAEPAPPGRVYAPPPPRKYVPPPRRRPYNEWGFHMRLQSALLDNDKHRAAEGAGMGGLGFSLRARPTGHFALDFGLDFLGGRDFHGNRRSEIPFSINAMLFVNPQDRAQLYFLGGLGWSSAHVERPDESIARYSYFGFQSGIGLEYRATRNLGLNLDLIGFIRGRTDHQAAYMPEFVDPATGRTTNTSGGGLFRGGLTVYW